MTVNDPPGRVRLKLLEREGDAVAEVSKARAEQRVFVPPPSLATRARRTAAFVARTARVLAQRALQGRDHSLVVPVDTEAGARRRRRADEFARQVLATLPAEWRYVPPDRIESGVVSMPLVARDGRTSTLVLRPRGAPRFAFETKHVAVSYTTGEPPPDAGLMRPLLAWAEKALRAAEAVAEAASTDFPRALFEAETSQLDYYPSEARIELRPTLACDHFCDFCCSVDRNSTTNALRGLRELRETRARWGSLPIAHVVISGGEPTLLRDLPEVIAELADDGYEVELQTNGMALDDRRYAETLANAGLRRVLISLHSADARRGDDQITHHPGAWMRTTRGIDHAISAGLRTSISHVVSRVNQDEMLAFLRFVDRRWHGRVQVRMGFVSPTGDAGVDPEIIPALETVAPALRDALAFVENRRMPFVLLGYCGVPPCLLHPYERFSDVTRRVDTTYSATRVKLEACRSCDYERACPGLWRGYVAKHGDPGLRPLRRKRSRP